jgi:hypothetical protein
MTRKNGERPIKKARASYRSFLRNAPANSRDRPATVSSCTVDCPTLNGPMVRLHSRFPTYVLVLENICKTPSARKSNGFLTVNNRPTYLETRGSDVIIYGADEKEHANKKLLRPPIPQLYRRCGAFMAGAGKCYCWELIRALLSPQRQSKDTDDNYSIRVDIQSILRLNSFKRMRLARLFVVVCYTCPSGIGGFVIR